MNKRIVFLLTVCLYLQPSFAQDNFTVIKVSGNIVIERTGSSLDIGTSFGQSENLLFKIPESRAAVINPQRGRFLLTSENVSQFRNSKSNFLPPAGKISTRSIVKTSPVNALKKQIEGNLVMLYENRIVVDTSAYPLSDKKFFYITYNYKNKIINKKLPFTSDTVLVRKYDLLTVDGKAIEDPKIDQMTLTYLQEGNALLSTPICSFKPVFPDMVLLKREIKIMIDQMEMRPYNEILNEISDFIRDFYGMIDKPGLEKWLDKNFGLKQ